MRVGKGVVRGLQMRTRTSPLRSVFWKVGCEESDGISVTWMGRGYCWSQDEGMVREPLTRDVDEP